MLPVARWHVAERLPHRPSTGDVRVDRERVTQCGGAQPGKDRQIHGQVDGPEPICLRRRPRAPPRPRLPIPRGAGVHGRWAPHTMARGRGRGAPEEAWGGPGPPARRRSCREQGST